MSKRMTLECGCDFQDYGMGLALNWCAMHEAAPQLMYACETLLDNIGMFNRAQVPQLENAERIARDALKRAKS
jgi:hypothetical protein